MNTFLKRDMFKVLFLVLLLTQGHCAGVGLEKSDEERAISILISMRSQDKKSNDNLLPPGKKGVQGRGRVRKGLKRNNASRRIRLRCILCRDWHVAGASFSGEEENLRRHIETHIKAQGACSICVFFKQPTNTYKSEEQRDEHVEEHVDTFYFGNGQQEFEDITK